MQLPSGLQEVQLGIGTSAVANTVTSGPALAAPGAAFRYRLWSLRTLTFDTSQAPAKWRAVITNSTGATILLGTAAPGFGADQAWADGGLAAATNDLLLWSVQSSVASITLRMLLYYTIEGV